jgi:hypothetical protein
MEELVGLADNHEGDVPAGVCETRVSEGGERVKLSVEIIGENEPTRRRKLEVMGLAGQLKETSGTFVGAPEQREKV